MQPAAPFTPPGVRGLENYMRQGTRCTCSSNSGTNPGSWRKILARVWAPFLGFAALLWFLIRVVPKPSRASYPCQRVAFPIASAFILWLAGSLASAFAFLRLREWARRSRYAVVAIGAAAALAVGVWFQHSLSSQAAVNGFTWTPEAANHPIGVARGINPGRVVLARDPLAAHWSGNYTSSLDNWWDAAATDQTRVDTMLSLALRKLTSTTTDANAWNAIFGYYNRTHRSLNRGYQAGEIIAIKINLNNSGAMTGGTEKLTNAIDASPQTVLAVVDQLVKNAGVPAEDIIVYDARRYIYGDMLRYVWASQPNARFLQGPPVLSSQTPGPLESANFSKVLTFSGGSYNLARYIPAQIETATYLVNLALLKAHAYPAQYSTMEGGGDGVTGITLCGKNHFGSVEGTSEMHDDARPHGVHYDPRVDLAAAPTLGAKTILFLLDALYGGRKYNSFPIHLPNPPFNNPVSVYENSKWPSSILASLDGVAIDSVGLDILYSNSKNNVDPNTGVARILIENNADNYLHEMAMASNPPSGTVYAQGGKRLPSLGVHEHWNSARQYSRNLDHIYGTGIELDYLPLDQSPTAKSAISISGTTVHISTATSNSRIFYTVNGATPTDHSTLYTAPFSAAAGTTVKAIAVNDNLRDSGVATAKIPVANTAVLAERP